MAKLRKFTAGWKGLSEKQLTENIKYLLKHYKEYEIEGYTSGYNVGTVFIGKLPADNYYINSVFVHKKAKLGADVEKLYNNCKKEYAMRINAKDCLISLQNAKTK